MPVVESHPHGTFSWADLGTTDQAAARDFYTTLFGWEAEENDMGDGQTYTMLKLNGKTVCALYQQRPEMADQGVPPFWLSYVTVDDADKVTERTKELGGQAIMGPMD